MLSTADILLHKCTPAKIRSPGDIMSHNELTAQNHSNSGHLTFLYWNVRQYYHSINIGLLDHYSGNYWNSRQLGCFSNCIQIVDHSMIAYNQPFDSGLFSYSDPHCTLSNFLLDKLQNAKRGEGICLNLMLGHKD